MKKRGSFGLLVPMITVSGASIAACPQTMPVQLLEDCIITEDAGSNFPPSDYAHMDEYQAWLKAQQEDQEIAKSKPNASGKPKI